MIEAKIAGYLTDQTGHGWVEVTCREGTSWCIDDTYLNDSKRKLFSPYLGLPVKIVTEFSPIEPDNTPRALRVNEQTSLAP